MFSIKHLSHEDDVEGKVKEDSTRKVTFLLGLKKNEIYLGLVVFSPRGHKEAYGCEQLG